MTFFHNFRAKLICTLALLHTATSIIILIRLNSCISACFYLVLLFFACKGNAFF